MGTCEDMEKCRAYINEHLDSEMTPESLAVMMGYSFYHFCHMFSVTQGIPIGEYLRKRRLAKAAKDILTGTPIKDAALSSGFETPSGFAKAFKKEFGISASQYRKNNKSNSKFIEPRIIEKAAFKAVGYNIPPKDGREWSAKEDAAQWLGADFSSVSTEDYQRLLNQCWVEIGMWYHPEAENGALTYFFGPVVDDFSFIPKGMVGVKIPGATYAVFTTKPVSADNGMQRFQKEIIETWQWIHREWLNLTAYQFDQTKLAFECYLYDQNYLDNDGATADIYVPIQK